jgi:hypothetical protein
VSRQRLHCGFGGSALSATPYAGGSSEHVRQNRPEKGTLVKKLIILVILAVLGVVAAKVVKARQSY